VDGFVNQLIKGNLLHIEIAVEQKISLVKDHKRNENDSGGEESQCKYPEGGGFPPLFPGREVRVIHVGTPFWGEGA
jgi:hypothetical protein